MAAPDDRSPAGGADPGPAPGGREARRHMARLRALARRLDHQAALIRNGGYNTQAEAQAGRLADEACAVRWALRRIAPELECVGQFLDALGGAGCGP